VGNRLTLLAKTLREVIEDKSIKIFVWWQQSESYLVMMVVTRSKKLIWIRSDCLKERRMVGDEMDPWIKRFSSISAWSPLNRYKKNKEGGVCVCAGGGLGGGGGGGVGGGGGAEPLQTKGGDGSGGRQRCTGLKAYRGQSQDSEPKIVESKKSPGASNSGVWQRRRRVRKERVVRLEVN